MIWIWTLLVYDTTYQHLILFNDIRKCITNICIFDLSFVGQFQTSVLKLQQPPDELLVRPISRTWIDEIKIKLQSPGSIHVTSTFPVLINKDQVATLEDFDMNKIDQYALYTLGGNHLRCAIQELLMEEGAEDRWSHLRMININVYVGLETVHARQMANRHNQQQTSRPSTFLDQVVQARRLLYEMCSLDIDTDEPPSEQPPNYRMTLLTELSLDKTVSMAPYIIYKHLLLIKYTSIL